MAATVPKGHKQQFSVGVTETPSGREQREGTEHLSETMLSVVVGEGVLQ